MRIRKRTSQPESVATAPATTISYKYQTMTSVPREGRRATPKCSNMQENRCSDRDDDHEASRVTQPASPAVSRRVSDAHVKDEDAAATGRRKPSSPTKRRKIEHDSSLNLFEGPASMTAAELLAVAQLANGVRQRLAASEVSTSEQEEIEERTDLNKSSSSKPAAAADAKDALISSIFYVFDTHGDHGLSASEVVKYMIDQRLPGLKEGGARHTVQVANVLRSSSSFFSLGDKKYLLCANATESDKPKPAHNKSKSATQAEESSDNELAKPVKRRQSTTRATGKKVQAEKPKDVHVTPEAAAEEVPVRVARRRGPSSAQKGKGPTQCKRYDGRGWQCSRLTEPGYSLCSHHQDLINKRAAKLKEQQTLSRLMESVHRKANKQPAAPATPPPAVTPPRDDAVAAPAQSKRKMLSLLAINK